MTHACFKPDAARASTHFARCSCSSMAHATCLAQDRDVFIVKSGALSESGDPVNIEWKLWQYKDGAVFWELRNVLSTYYEGATENWSPHRVVKQPSTTR